MADERDLELLDDYLTNRMSEGDRSAFEQKLKADPDLQHEYALQRRLIEGIKDARVAELKSMLNQVPVPSSGTGNALATKIILGTVAGLMIAAAALWYFKKEEPRVPDHKAQSEQGAPAEEQPQPGSETDSKVQPEQEAARTEKQSVESDKNQTSAGTEQSRPSLSKKPDPLAAPGETDASRTERDGPVLDVFTPEDGDSSGSERAKNESQVLTPATSSLIVEADKTNRRYTFHYQFRDGKLLLFGPFEKNLYEVLEFFTDEKRTVFLFYNDRYYLLDEADNQIRPLKPITDPALIKKLAEYRNPK